MIRNMATVVHLRTTILHFARILREGAAERSAIIVSFANKNIGYAPSELPSGGNDVPEVLAYPSIDYQIRLP